MTIHATGEFDDDLKPMASYDAAVGRMSIDKQFRGDLKGASKGEMLAIEGNIEGSASYVAMERVSGARKVGSAAHQTPRRAAWAGGRDMRRGARGSQ